MTVAGLSAVHVLLFAYFGYQSRVLRPYSDLFDLIAFYFQFQENGDWAHYLLEPHNYHRLILFRLLLAFDVGALKGTGLTFIAVAVLCFILVALLLTRLVLAMPLQRARLPGAALVLVLLLSSANAVVASVPANTPYVHTLLFSVLTLLLAEPLGSDRSALAWRRLAALLCACAAAFSNAVGFVLWPVLAFMAWRGGERDRPWLALVLACGGAFATLYTAGLTPEDSVKDLSLPAMVRSAEYFFTYMGLPWARASGDVGRLIGAALTGCAMVAVVRTGGRGAGRAERVALSLVLFTVATALLAALGRRDVVEAVVVPGRYNILTVPLKVGLVILILPWLERQWASRPRAVEAAVAASMMLYLVQQVAIGEVVAHAAQHLRGTIVDFGNGRRAPDMTLLIHPDIGRAEALEREIERRGLYQHPVLFRARPRSEGLAGDADRGAGR